MGGDYVWIIYTRHPVEGLSDKALWLLPSAVEVEKGIVLNLTDEEVAYRRKAFYGLRMVRLLL